MLLPCCEYAKGRSAICLRCLKPMPCVWVVGCCLPLRFFPRPGKSFICDSCGGHGCTVQLLCLCTCKLHCCVESKPNFESAFGTNDVFVLCCDCRRCQLTTCIMARQCACHSIRWHISCSDRIPASRVSPRLQFGTGPLPPFAPLLDTAARGTPCFSGSQHNGLRCDKAARGCSDQAAAALSAMAERPPISS